MVNGWEHPQITRVLATGEVAGQKVWTCWEEDTLYEERKERQLFMPPAPRVSEDPCRGCWRERLCDTGCERWRGYYLGRQSKINAYARAAYRGKERPGKDVFAYSHPDLVRQYEKTHPCRGCHLEKGCVMPCGRYLHWYDCRMALARKRSTLPVQ